MSGASGKWKKYPIPTIDYLFKIKNYNESLIGLISPTVAAKNQEDFLKTMLYHEDEDDTGTSSPNVIFAPPKKRRVSNADTTSDEWSQSLTHPYCFYICFHILLVQLFRYGAIYYTVNLSQSFPTVQWCSFNYSWLFFTNRQYRPAWTSLNYCYLCNFLSMILFFT